MAGATLLVYVSWAGSLLGLACVALLVTGQSLLWIAAVVGAGIGYLALIAARPARLARTRLLGPLFEAGIPGHLHARWRCACRTSPSSSPARGSRSRSSACASRPAPP